MAVDRRFSNTGWLSFTFPIDFSDHDNRLLAERIIELIKADGRSCNTVFSDTKPQSTLDPHYYPNPQ